MQYLVDPPPIPVVPVQGSDGVVFPVHRIFCVGRNYADHIQEMGGNPQEEPPVFFAKPTSAVLYCPADQGERVVQMPFPLATQDLHHE